MRNDKQKEICGKTVSADEVTAEVLKDKPFYENSGGGMTLSGGEPPDAQMVDNWIEQIKLGTKKEVKRA